MSTISFSKIIAEIEDEMTDEQCLIHSYCRVYGDSPEEVVLAKERIHEYIVLFKFLQSKLCHRDFKVLIDWLIYGKTYTEIGKYSNRTNKKSGDKYYKQQWAAAGKREVLRVLRRLRKISLNPAVLLCKENLIQDFRKDAHKPMLYAGWSVDRLQKANVGAHWKRPTKTCHCSTEYITDYKCLIPEYLANAFHDQVPICSACGIRCTRKSFFK